MNWGMKIVLGLGAFMLFVIVAAIYMVSKDSDSLLYDDYYEKSLSYDQVYDKKQNMESDHAKPVLKLRGDTLLVTFTTLGNRGDLIFKRPSNGSLDQKVSFDTQSDVYKLPITKFAKGNWQIELSWQTSDKSYIDNQSLFIQ